MKINANLFSFLNKQDLLPETHNLDKISRNWRLYLCILKAKLKHYGYNEERIIIL